MQEQEIGNVLQYFSRASVVGIRLNAPLKVGDRIRIKGHTTDLTAIVESMQINNQDKQEAQPGDEVGIKVPDRARPGDKVYKVA